MCLNNEVCIERRTSKIDTCGCCDQVVLASGWGSEGRGSSIFESLQITITLSKATLGIFFAIWVRKVAGY